MIIIVMGLPGSGKSYFAAKLSRLLGAVYLSSDKTRKKMRSMGRYTFEDKQNVYKEMAALTGKELSKGKPVVVDATFYAQPLRDLFIDLAQMQEVPVCFILIEAAESLIKQRLNLPREDSEADYEVYQTVRSSFEELHSPYLKLISRQDNVKDMLEQAVDYIRRHERRRD